VPDAQTKPGLQAFPRQAQPRSPAVQPDPTVQVPDEQVKPVLQAPLLKHAQPAVPAVQLGPTAEDVQIPDEQVRPVLQVPLLEHRQFALPAVQLLPPVPQPELRAKAAARTNRVTAGCGIRCAVIEWTMIGFHGVS
jgi:hypothetical protein